MWLSLYVCCLLGVKFLKKLLELNYSQIFYFKATPERVWMIEFPAQNEYSTKIIQFYPAIFAGLEGFPHVQVLVCLFKYSVCC